MSLKLEFVEDENLRVQVADVTKLRAYAANDSSPSFGSDSDQALTHTCDAATSRASPSSSTWQGRQSEDNLRCHALVAHRREIITLCIEGDFSRFDEARQRKLCELLAVEIDAELVTEEQIKIVKSEVSAVRTARIGTGRCRVKAVVDESGYANFSSDTPSRVLTSLDLSRNDLGAQAAMVLASALKANAALTSLNLFDNKIGPEGGKALAQALRVNAVLTECNVRDNPLDSESANALAAVATEKRVMLFGIKHDQTEANFSSKRLGPVDAILIASDVRASAVLTDLRVGSNEIGPKGAKAFADALQVNAVLTDLPQPLIQQNRPGGRRSYRCRSPGQRGTDHPKPRRKPNWL
jgi:hypothetical protein